MQEQEAAEDKKGFWGWAFAVLAWLGGIFPLLTFLHSYPTFGDVFDAFGQKLPWLTQAALDFRRALNPLLAHRVDKLLVLAWGTLLWNLNGWSGGWIFRNKWRVLLILFLLNLLVMIPLFLPMFSLSPTTDPI